MEKEFIPYEQALDLKELGFNEPCLKYWNGIGKYFDQKDWFDWNQSEYFVSVPLYQQAFRWFREKYEYEVSIHKLIEEDGYMASIRWEGVEDIFDQVEGNTYPEAELACLIKLIEIVKEKK